MGGAAGEQDGVEAPAEIGQREPGADVGSGHEPDTLRRELVQPAVEDPLLQLELGDPVSQEAADSVGPLEDGLNWLE